MLRRRTCEEKVIKRAGPGQKLQWRIIPNGAWNEVGCMAEVYDALAMLPYHSIELRQHPSMRPEPARGK